MTSLSRPASAAPKKRTKKGRTPLGFYVSALLAGEVDTVSTMRELLGELGDRIVEAFTCTRWNEQGRGDPLIHAEPQHDPNEACIRIACAHALRVLERTSPDNQRACSSALFRGHTHRIDANGDRVYVPGARAGGLAARLGRSPRTLDRHCRVLELAGICDVWQPPPDETLPKTMRGHRYCYAVYEWRQRLPLSLIERLIEWWGTAEQRRLSTRRRRRLSGVGTRAVVDPGRIHVPPESDRTRGPLGPDGERTRSQLKAFLDQRVDELEPVPLAEEPPSSSADRTRGPLGPDGERTRSQLKAFLDQRVDELEPVPLAEEPPSSSADRRPTTAEGRAMVQRLLVFVQGDQAPS